MEVYLMGETTIFIDTGECLIFLDTYLFYLARDLARFKKRAFFKKFTWKSNNNIKNKIKAYVYLFKTSPFFSEIFDITLLDANDFEITEIKCAKDINFNNKYYFNFKDGTSFFDIRLDFMEEIIYDKWVDKFIDDKTFLKYNKH